MSSGIVETKENKEVGEDGAARPSPNANRSQLVQRLLDSPMDLPAFVNDLMTTQAITVAGTEAAGFLIERGGERTSACGCISHIRPDNSSPETRAAAVSAFQDLIKPCVAAEPRRRDRDRRTRPTAAKPSSAWSRCSAPRARSSPSAPSSPAA